MNDLIEEFKSRYYPTIEITNEKVFTAFCIKYFFYDDIFSADETLEYIVDGANDGGIDAIFNDSYSENNDLIIIQSKYYDSTKLSVKDVESEIHKILKTLKDLKKRNDTNYKKELVQSYLDCTENTNEDSQIKIYIFTSFEVKDNNTKNGYLKEIKKLETENYSIDIFFGRDIIEQVVLIDTGKFSVPKAKMKIDKVDNFLSYGDSIIVNASAQSINELFKKYHNKGLLASNLRYYIKDKKVDKGINQTIKNEPDNFWYFNNGIIIVSSNYEINSKEIVLYDFSIVNGGQTTALIGQINFSQNQDFFVQVKIIKTVGETEKDQEKFILKVAESSNSQKAIKDKDLISNKMEQLKLKSELSKLGIYYVLKRGEFIEKKYNSFVKANSDMIGKLIMASILQMPGTSRSGTKKIYSEDYYHRIFPDEPRTLLANQLVQLKNHYNQYKKNKKSFSSEDKISILANGELHFISIFTLLTSATREFIKEQDYKKQAFDQRKEYLYTKLKRYEKIYEKSLDDETEITYKVFDIILDEILTYVYRIEKKSREQNRETITVANYLKLDSVYYNDIVPRAFEVLQENELLMEYLIKFNNV